MQDCFGIAVCLVNVTTGLELFAKISVVVDLTVVCDMKSVVLICHWLMAGRNVYNAQTAVAQSDRTINEDAFIIRSAMGDNVAHALEHGSVYHPP
jgi:hypothetical protein